jgi:hypothetical protein
MDHDEKGMILPKEDAYRKTTYRTSTDSSTSEFDAINKGQSKLSILLFLSPLLPVCGKMHPLFAAPSYRLTLMKFGLQSKLARYLF